MVGLLAILIWFVYVNQICLGLFFIAVGMVSLMWGKDYMESQFSPERS
jgi:hypothetical protein